MDIPDKGGSFCYQVVQEKCFQSFGWVEMEHGGHLCALFVMCHYPPPVLRRRFVYAAATVPVDSLCLT